MKQMIKRLRQAWKVLRGKDIRFESSEEERIKRNVIDKVGMANNFHFVCPCGDGKFYVAYLCESDEDLDTMRNIDATVE